LNRHDEAPLSLFHLRIAVACAAGVFSDGFGLGIIGICLSRASTELALTPFWMGLLGGASLFGLFAGSLLTGPAADRFGRRPIFAYNMAVLTALSVLQAFAPSAGTLLAFRVAIGFILGTDYVVSKTLLTEFVPRQLRGRILAFLSIAWAGGYSVAYGVGFAMGRSDPHMWRWMLMTSAVPSLLVVPFRLTVPESPLWLASRGQAAAAREVRDEPGTETVPRIAAESPKSPGAWRQLFSSQWRRRTGVACVFFVCLVIPYFALGTFVSQVMSAMRVDNGYLGGLFYNCSLLIGAIAGLLVVDRIGRRSFVIGSLLITAGSLLVLSWFVHLPLLTMTLLFAVFACVLSAASTLTFVYLPELFPTNLRASGIGLAIATSRIGSALATFLLPIVVEHYGVRAALGACVGVLAFGAAVCYVWAPETRNTELATLEAAQ
jgi:MFS transporter, putative metabolite transport protein